MEKFWTDVCLHVGLTIAATIDVGMACLICKLTGWPIEATMTLFIIKAIYEVKHKLKES